MGISGVLSPFWRSRLLLDKHHAVLTGLSMTDADRHARARAQGFDTEATYTLSSPTLLERYIQPGSPAMHTAPFEFDLETQGILFKRSKLSWAPRGMHFFLRTGHTLKPLGRYSPNTLAQEKAEQHLRWIPAPWAKSGTFTATNIAPMDKEAPWLTQVATESLPWTLFDHPEVVNRARQCGYQTIETSDIDTPHQHHLMVLSLPDAMPHNSAFSSLLDLTSPELTQTNKAPIATRLHRSLHISAIDKAADARQERFAGPVLNVWGVHFSDDDKVTQWYNCGQVGHAVERGLGHKQLSVLPSSLRENILLLNGKPTRIQELNDALTDLQNSDNDNSQKALVDYFLQRADQFQREPPSFLTPEGNQRTVTRLRFLAAMLKSAKDYEVIPAQALYPNHGAHMMPPGHEQLLQWDTALDQQPAPVQAFFRDKHSGRLGPYHGMAGGEAYEHLTRLTGSHEAASRALSAGDIAGISYRDRARTRNDAWVTSYILWDTESISTEHIAEQWAKTKALSERRTARRNAIAFKANHFADLALEPNADFKTLCRDGAHLFLEMYTDAATLDGASAQLQDDYTQLLDWLGLSDQAWRNFTEQQRSPYHDRFVESFFQYLSTRISPIKNTHHQYHKWMGQVMDTAKQEQPEAELSPAMTNLFDRLTQASAKKPAKNAVTKRVFETIKLASLASGQTAPASTVQATLYAAAYGHLFSELAMSSDEFMNRYSFAITVQQHQQRRLAKAQSDTALTISELNPTFSTRTQHL